MAPAYKEVLREEEAAKRIHPNFFGWRKDVVLFGDDRDGFGPKWLAEKTVDEYCIYCPYYYLFLPAGRCSGAYVEIVDGTQHVIAHAPRTLFTRKNSRAVCTSGEKN